VEALADWQSIPGLNRPETIHFLQLAQRTGNHPARVRSLESLLVNNRAIQMIDAVEQAKIDLSTSFFTRIQLCDEDINVWKPITRSQFEWLISEATRRIQECLEDTLERSGLGVRDIDTVIRTGGSAQIPLFIDLIGQMFGPDKVVLSDVFSSVTGGLAIRAYEPVDA
jgi:molecular chaperone DnaK (HSP70)